MSGIFPLLLPHTSLLLEFLTAFHFYELGCGREQREKKKIFSLKAGALFPEFRGEM